MVNKNKLFKINDKIEIKKIGLKFDITMLNMLIGFIFKTSSQVTRKSLLNMKNLFSIIDDRIYEGNEKIEARIYFINRALEARLDKGFENEDAIINYCRTDNHDKEIEEVIKSLMFYKKINYEEIKYINKSIIDRLKYAYLFNYKESLYSSIERLDSGDYNTFQEINDEIIAICSKIMNHNRNVSTMDNTRTFSLEDGVFEDIVTDIVNTLKDPARILKTGIQKLNQILSPGYMGKCLYVYLGLPAGFKSGLLLDTAVDIKKYNKGLKVKKAGKKPCVLIVTLENSIEESVERLFNMSVTSDDIRGFTAKQVIKKLREDGQLTLVDKDDIDIIIKYYSNREISTADLYTIIDDLADEGKEVIALILDYIKRIRPFEKAKDEKEELKNITNELKNLAVDKDIPVITAHQLNRTGAISVDAAMMSNKEDLARFLGRGNVGTAWEIIENADFSCIINIERKKNTNQYYLTFKRIKIRYRDNYEVSYFNHPFEIGNRIRLIEDIYLEHSLSEDSLATDFEGVDLNIDKKGNRTAVERKIINDTEDNDIFDFAASINKKKVA